MTTRELEDTNIINQNYGDAATYYKNIAKTNNVQGAPSSFNRLLYFEITQDYNETPIMTDIGCICNTEYSNFSFDATRYWDSDNMLTNIQNAKKMSNDLEWTEQSNMHNGTIKSNPGMVVIHKSPNGYTQDDVNFFGTEPANASNISQDFNTFAGSGSGSGVAIEIFGYFHPDATGSWEFILPSTNTTSNIFTYLWLGNTALYDYTASNANINSKTAQNNNQVSITVTLNKDDYIPFRAQIISKSINFNSSITPITIIPPSNSKASNPLLKNPSSDWNYFVTFVKGGAVYYKQLLYFGLVQDHKNKSKYNCFFIPSSDSNVANMRTYKENQQLQYFKIEIPTPTTFSGKGTVRMPDGTVTSIKLPKGVPLTINKATYGLDFDYTYNTYQTKKELVPKHVDPTTYTVQAKDNDPNLASKTVTVGAQGYTKMVEEQKTSITPVKVSQQKDVTTQVQNIVNGSGGNNLVINTSNYASVFGNPITDNNSPYINVPKNLTVQYSYTFDEANVEGKNIYLDPESGILTIGFTFSGYPGTTPINMDKYPACGGINCSNYKMVLTNNGHLSVLDTNNNEVGYLDLKKYTKKIDPHFNLSKCQVNQSWLNNPLTPNSLAAGYQLSSVNGNKLISSDGRFKLEFVSGKLIFTFCYIPYTKASNGIKYTSAFNVNSSNNSQIYYLYRMPTMRGAIGRKFLLEDDTETNLTTLHYLPNTHNNILKYDKFANPINKPAYPLMKDGTLANSKNYKEYKNIDNTTCANKCISDPNSSCEHYFFINNKNNTTTCYTDTNSDSNPVFTTGHNNPNMRNATLYKKQYKITSTCGLMENNRNLLYLNNSLLPIDVPFTTDYRAGENAPNMTYYCGLERYLKDNSMVNTTYTKGQGQGATAVKESMTNVEVNTGMANIPKPMTAYQDSNFSANVPYLDTVTNSKLTVLNNMTKQYSQEQDYIGEQYDQTLSHLKTYVDISNQLVSDQYKFNGTDSIIPEKYYNNKNPKPNISLQDGLKKDVGVMLMQQNTMYTVASIAAVSCLGLAMFLGSE